MANLPADLVITLEQTGPGHGRYVARTAEGPACEMTFKHRAGGFIVDHTGVPQELEGRGIARALLDRALNDARALGLTITPRCSYIVAQFARHPEWADVIKPD
jgi:predicted GNAT family acetyltransferase